MEADTRGETLQYIIHPNSDDSAHILQDLQLASNPSSSQVHERIEQTFLLPPANSPQPVATVISNVRWIRIVVSVAAELIIYTIDTGTRTYPSQTSWHRRLLPLLHRSPSFDLALTEG